MTVVCASVGFPSLLKCQKSCLQLCFLSGWYLQKPGVFQGTRFLTVCKHRLLLLQNRQQFVYLICSLLFLWLLVFFGMKSLIVAPKVTFFQHRIVPWTHQTHRFPTTFHLEKFCTLVNFSPFWKRHFGANVDIQSKWRDVLLHPLCCSAYRLLWPPVAREATFAMRCTERNGTSGLPTPAILAQPW